MTEQEGIERRGLSKSAKVILACTIALIVFLSFAMWFMWNYLQELSGSPLIVGADKIAEANNANDVMCTCQVISDTKPPISFWFNRTAMWDDPGKVPFSLSN